MVGFLHKKKSKYRFGDRFEFNKSPFKVDIFWEGHNILRNLHPRFVLRSNGQIYGGDLAKFCDLLRIYDFISFFTIIHHCIYV